MLRRYWTDLAAQKRSPAQSLMRLPTEVADLADELWQRSLGLAAQSAAHDDNAARERLEQVKRENEVRSHTLTVRERTFREREESRDLAMKELQEQVATLLSIVSRNAETIATLQDGKAAAEAQAKSYRRRLAQVIARAVANNNNRAVAETKPRPVTKVKRKAKPKGRAKFKTEAQLKRSKRRTKR